MLLNSGYMVVIGLEVDGILWLLVFDRWVDLFGNDIKIIMG